MAASDNPDFTGSIIVKSGTITVDQITGTVTITGAVTFPSAQEVTLAATGPVSVKNTFVPAQEMVYVGYTDYPVTNLAAGADAIFEVLGGTSPEDIILADGVVVALYSANGNQYELGTGSLWFCRVIDAHSGDSHYGSGVSPITSPLSIQWTADRGLSNPIYFSAPFAGNDLLVDIYNNTGSTIVSDTVRAYVWAIKAQISNPTTNPAQTQPAQGVYDTTTAFNITVAGTGISLIAAGNYVKSLQYTFYAIAAGTFTLFNGTDQLTPAINVVASGYFTGRLDFGAGTVNNGITLTMPNNGQFTGIGITSATTPNPKVSVTTS